MYNNRETLHYQLFQSRTLARCFINSISSQRRQYSRKSWRERIASSRIKPKTRINHGHRCGHNHPIVGHRCQQVAQQQVHRSQGKPRRHGWSAGNDSGDCPLVYNASHNIHTSSYRSDTRRSWPSSRSCPTVRSWRWTVRINSVECVCVCSCDDFYHLNTLECLICVCFCICWSGWNVACVHRTDSRRWLQFGHRAPAVCVLRGRGGVQQFTVRQVSEVTSVLIYYIRTQGFSVSS